MRVSIIITSFQRAQLLYWGLFSLARQKLPFKFETLVINDGLPDETEAVCVAFRPRLNLKYIFSGQRNLSGAMKWRVPGFAYNIGARQSSGDVLLLSCAEMFHLNNTIMQLTNPVFLDNKALAIPIGKDDRDGAILQKVKNHNGKFDPQVFHQYIDLDTRLPFLIAIKREEYFAIGGFDEDFTGIAFDDNDLVERLQKNGCHYQQTQAKCIHLYHSRYVYEVGMSPEWHYNRNLYLGRGQQIVRNLDHEWGKL